MTNKEYEELYCLYCDSQRCHMQKGDTVANKCLYYNERTYGKAGGMMDKQDLYALDEAIYKQIQIVCKDVSKCNKLCQVML